MPSPELFEGFLIFSGSITMAGLAILIWIVLRLLKDASFIKEIFQEKSDNHS